MGRYYTGNIEGKFWFGIQSSSDGEFFGMEGQEHNTIPYYSDNMGLAKKGIDLCVETLGDDKKILDDFFEANNSYNDNMIVKWYKEKHNKEVTEGDVHDMLTWYARLSLGKKIVEAMEKEGNCYYDAEM